MGISDCTSKPDASGNPVPHLPRHRQASVADIVVMPLPISSLIRFGTDPPPNLKFPSSDSHSQTRCLFHEGRVLGSSSQELPVVEGCKLLPSPSASL
ncbi:hypothetical protein Tco_0103886 [Tanacetum coccineum]